MELIHGRPLLTEIYNPPQQALNAENAYLLNVGLVVLIRGSPTPDLPQLIAARMVQIHGGNVADCNVTQATITPYIITCPSTRIRDAVVRGGIYTLPQSGIQFKIHEWRPRFGMGYNPPTHQIWIKLVGLPLQAWTESEVTKFIQNFGYPLQVAPFGQAAGHYTDITALVAAKHPTCIPLACMYREGDYSTQVDILILAWRPWEDSYFPPPHNFMLQEDPQDRVDRHKVNTVSTNRSSSSSSNNALSEPTIDYSSWSPRSFRFDPITVTRWMAKSNNPQRKIAPLNPTTHFPLWTTHANPNNSNLFLLSLQTPLFSPSCVLLLTLSNVNPLLSWLIRPQKQITAATEDPDCLLEFPSTHSVLQVHTLSTPNPILINSLLSLQTHKRDSTTLPAAQKNPLPLSSHATPHLSPTPSINLVLRESYLSPSHVLCLTILKKLLSTVPDPLQPITHGPSFRALTLAKTKKGSAHFSYSQTQKYRQLISDFTASPCEAPSHAPLDLSGDQPISTAQVENHLTLHLSNSGRSHMTQSRNLNNEASSRIDSLSVKPKKKEKQLPTRRSHRIQARQQAVPAKPVAIRKNRTTLAKIPFDLDSSLDNLDANKTREILRATGLQINNQVEQMIEAAFKADQANDIDELPCHLHHSTTLFLLVPCQERTSTFNN